MKKRRGYTLIELSAYMLVFICIASSSLALMKSANNIIIDLKSSYCIYQIHDFIINAKSICKDKKRVGKIILNSDKKSITFIEGYDGIKEEMKCPNDFSLYSDFIYYISDSGRIKGATTIILVDPNEEKHNITIKPDVDIIRLKEEEYEKE